jgi:hypothetical protein
MRLKNPIPIPKPITTFRLCLSASFERHRQQRDVSSLQRVRNAQTVDDASSKRRIVRNDVSSEALFCSRRRRQVVRRNFGRDASQKRPAKVRRKR